MARYNTTVTKKDGTKVSGYIENDRGYYNDGSAIGAGDSIVDKQGTVWTKPDTASIGAGGTGSGTGAGAGTGSGTGTPSAADLISQAIRDNNSGGGGGSNYSSYKVTGAKQPARTSYLRSAKELSDLYDIGYDMDEIRGIYDKATNAKYALLSKEREQAENDFYSNNANANATLLDTLKKATSSAIATGASRGLAGAEQLGLMMEQQQAITDEATNLAQERANMADEIAAEKAENIIKALEYSNQLKQGLATNSTNIYSPDVQYDVGLLEFFGQLENADVQRYSTDAEVGVNNRALNGELLQALLDDARIRAEGAADRASNEKIAADNNATQQAYYNSLSANGGSGYGLNDYLAEFLNRGKANDYAVLMGDRTLATTNLLNQGHSPETAEQILNTDINFLMSEKFGGTQNIPQGMNASTFYNYLWSQGDMDTLAKLIVAQDKTTKSYAEKIEAAEKQVKADKELKANNAAGGYNNREEVQYFNQVMNLLDKAKKELDSTGSISENARKEIQGLKSKIGAQDPWGGPYKWVNDELYKKYGFNLNSLEYSGTVTENQLKKALDKIYQ